LRFNAHVHAFEIIPVNPVEYEVINITELPDHNALFGYTGYSSASEPPATYVRLCYHISDTC